MMLTPLFVRRVDTPVRLAGLAAWGCSFLGVPADLDWAPSIRGAPSADGRSLRSGNMKSVLAS